MKIKGYDNVDVIVELLDEEDIPRYDFDTIKEARAYCKFHQMKFTDFKIQWCAAAVEQNGLPEIIAVGKTRAEAIHDFAVTASRYCKR